MNKTNIHTITNLLFMTKIECSICLHTPLIRESITQGIEICKRVVAKTNDRVTHSVRVKLQGACI